MKPNYLKIQGCEFCSPDLSTVVKETPNFWVVKDSDGLTEGHYVIHSKNHYACMGELPLEFFDELKILKKEIVQNLKTNQTHVVSFEHGRVGHCTKLRDNSKPSHHFHLNIVPLNVDISADLDARFYSIYVEHLDEISKLYERFNEYLFFENTEGDLRYYIVDELIEPQLLKSLIAKKIGLQEDSLNDVEYFAR